jgi:biotin synthase
MIMAMSNQEIRELVERVIDDAPRGRPVTDEEDIAALFDVPIFSTESAMLQAAANRVSRMACVGKAEVHAQVAVNVGPCPRNCLFCAFAQVNGVFHEEKEFSLDYVIDQCLQFERDGANAVFLMSTGIYPLDRFIERGAAVREKLRPDTTLIANVGDFDSDGANALREAGFSGVYHAVRLGEGRDTRIPVERRFATFRAVKEAGLSLGTCLEPVGPEHSTAELVEKLLITRDAEPAYSGSARRIPIPGTELGAKGTLSEARMAHILAVVRLVLPLSIKGNCTHEPNALGAAAGANLFWAETGANPRDVKEKTEEGRGKTVPECREIMREAEWDVLEGPSVFYGN